MSDESKFAESHAYRGTTCGVDNGQTGSYSGSEVGFAEIAVDLLQARFWITNGMVRRLYPASSWDIKDVRRKRPMELHTIGIDLGKTVFHLVGHPGRADSGFLARR
jgi:hypothetical protein